MMTVPVSDCPGIRFHALPSNTQLDVLLDEDPVQQQSIKRRNAYLGPLNHIQLETLKRYRDPELSDEAWDLWLIPLLRTINAISAGLRNTG
ncbi:MAG: phosphoenolpyruvate carboxylase [Candidatus Thiodiazotropha sp.]